MGLILDTSVLISVERGKLAWQDFLLSVSREPLFMAAITLSELWHGYHRASSAVAARRLVFVKGMASTIPVAEFATKEALIHAKIWADWKRRAKKSATTTSSLRRRPYPMGFPLPR